jgi:hypothetical protein
MQSFQRKHIIILYIPTTDLIVATPEVETPNDSPRDICVSFVYNNKDDIILELL